MSSSPEIVLSEARMPPVPADAFVAAVSGRNFAAMKRLCTHGVKLRAVLPSRYLETDGSDVVACFRRWFERAQRFDVIEAGSRDVAGRARIHWHLDVEPHPVTGDPGRYEIEQLAFIETHAGQISQIDLVCSGFRRSQPTCYPTG